MPACWRIIFCVIVGKLVSDPRLNKQVGRLKKLMLAGLASLIALPALADKNPQPKASGIVIHLFGPEMITSSGTTAKPPAAAATAADTAPATPPAPSLGQVMHEMFVTGDPAQDSTPHFPRGRAASNRP